MKIYEKELKSLIRKTIIESVFGYNGQDFQNMGLKNPADNYMVDKQELSQKTQEFIKAIDEYYSYIDGVEEDAENGNKEVPGIARNIRMHSMWSDDEDEGYFCDNLEKVSRELYSIKNMLQELVENYCQ